MADQGSLQKYYYKATSILRQRHIEEFHEILAEIYKENDVDVKPRGSREQQRQRRIEKQKKLLAELQS